MSEKKHTPEPWTLRNDGWCPQADEYENQTLIAAVPVMVEALKAVVRDDTDTHADPDATYRKALAALQLAGVTP